MTTDNRLDWIKSNGDPLHHGVAAANATKYYAEVHVGRADAFSVSLNYDAAEVSANTLESSNDPLASIYADTGAGWKSWATELGTKTAASSAALVEWQVVDAQAKRWRVKRDVTTGGMSTAREMVKGN